MNLENNDEAAITSQEVSEALESLIQKGLVEVFGVDENGELLFCLTQKGLKLAQAFDDGLF